ncbi:MAG: NAD-dependent epimerase/dehydratase family protein [Armatimonadota bacterium]
MVDEITSVDQLEEMISAPSQGVIETLRQLQGDIVVLGAGGKMGPSLARMARRAADEGGVSRRVIGVDLFPSAEQEMKLRAAGVETIRCDLTDQAQLESLPDAANVVFMVGMKFGSTGREALTWALNAFLPGLVCRKYSRSRIVAFSTGNVYGMVPLHSGGSVETDAPNPSGEYAASALARERIFEYFSRTMGIPTSIIRLNYSNEMRYGVLVDIAQKVWNSEPVDVTMGMANVIWQADANAMALQSLAHAASPPFVINAAGPEIVSVRRVALEFGELMGREVVFTGAESPDAFLSNGQLGHRLFGYPRVPVQQMIRWVAKWIMRGGQTLGKPTHFETRDGRF